MIDRSQAQALANLACELRPRGATKWDPAGVFAILANVRHLDHAEVTQAVIAAATNPNLKTPGAIGNTASEVWRTTDPGAAATREPYDPNTTCQVCGKSRYHCERNPHSGHEFETRDEMLRNRSPRGADLPETADEDPLLTYLDRRGA